MRLHRVIELYILAKGFLDLPSSSMRELLKYGVGPKPPLS